MNAITALFVVALSLAAQSALAINETLYFRLTSSGAVEAVVAGEDYFGCIPRFLPPTSVAITGTSIAITSPVVPLLPCFPPPPPYPRYEVVANLGVLSAPLYSVTWTMGPTVLSASLSPGSLSPQGIPTLGNFTLLTMTLLIAFFGMRRARRILWRE